MKVGRRVGSKNKKNVSKDALIVMRFAKQMEKLLKKMRLEAARLYLQTKKLKRKTALKLKTSTARRK